MTDQKQPNDVTEIAAQLQEAIDLSSPARLIESLALILAEQQLQQQRLAREVAFLKAALKARDIVAATVDKPKSRRALQQVDVVADMHIPTEYGFYALEYGGDGTPFRWTGPQSEFAFPLVLDRSSDLGIRIECLHSIDPANSDQMYCRIGDLVIELSPVKGAKKGFAFDGVIPALRDTSGEWPQAVLTFGVPKVICPAEHDSESTDRRHLGVCFTRLAIAPVQRAKQTRVA